MRFALAGLSFFLLSCSIKAHNVSDYSIQWGYDDEPIVVPPVEPPIDPPVEPPIDPPVEPPIEPPVEPPIEPVAGWSCAAPSLYCWIPDSQESIDEITYPIEYDGYQNPQWDAVEQAAYVRIPAYPWQGATGGRWIARFEPQTRDYWVQIRAKETAAFQWEHASNENNKKGGKRIINYHLSSCSGDEVTLKMSENLGFYEACGGRGYEVHAPDGNTNNYDYQPGGSSACWRHNQENAPGPCWQFEPDRWYTMTLHVRFLPENRRITRARSYTITGRSRAWVQYDDETEPTMVIDHPAGPVTALSAAEFSFYAARTQAEPASQDTFFWHQGIRVTNTPPPGFDGAIADGPLADLPSEPGPHIAQIEALEPRTWLNLGAPTPDPEHGPGRGRSWSPGPAYAPDLGAAVIMGEGPHGFVTDRGLALDDILVYDVNAHAWRFGFPGSNIYTIDLELDERGFEVDPETGRPHPLISMGHGYNLYTYDEKRRQVAWLHTTDPFPAAPLWERRQTWLPEGTSKHMAGRPAFRAPWTYSVPTGRFNRELPATGGEMTTIFEGVYRYVPHLDQMVHLRHGRIWYWDPAAGVWELTDVPQQPNGTAGFGYDVVACYNPEDTSLYVGFGSDFRAFDVDAREWRQLDSVPFLGTGSYGNLTCGGDHVLSNYYQRGASRPTGLRTYDIAADTWSDIEGNVDDVPGLTTYKQIGMWYVPELGVHQMHVAADGQPDGQILVWRAR